MCNLFLLMSTSQSSSLADIFRHANGYVFDPPTKSHFRPVFFHSSNASGPYGQAAIELMAKFPMVTIEKFQVSKIKKVA